MSVSWMLLRKSGRQSMARLVLTSAAIALGIVLVCYFVAGVNGLLKRADRAIINTAILQSKNAAAQQRQRDTTVKPLKASNVQLGNLTKWRDKKIDVLSLHGIEGSVQFAQLPTPASGEYYMSKALAEKVAQHPEDKIIDRFGKHTKYLGTIPDAYLQSPDSLMLIRGVSAEEVTATDKAAQSREQSSYFTNIYQTDATAGYRQTIGLDPISVIVLGVGGTILLFPIVMFVAVATQLGGVQREKRYAALRLIGATKKQVTRVILLESLIASIVGVVIGLVVFWLSQAPLQNFEMGGARFWPADLQLNWLQYLLIIALTLALTIGVSWRRMRRAQISPLGVARTQEKVKKLRIWRVLPLAIGLGIFAWASTPAGHQWLYEQADSSLGAMMVLAAGVVLVMFGLVLAGGWLTNCIARWCARWARSGLVLIASKRIAVHSRAVFRSVSGVVLALFAGSFYLTAVSGIEMLSASSVNNNGYSQLKGNTAIIIGDSLPQSMQQTLNRQQYIVNSAAVYPLEKGHAMRCSDLASYTEHTCPSGARPDQFALINFDAPVTKSVTLMDTVETKGNVNYLVTLQNAVDVDQLRGLVGERLQSANPTWVVSGTDAKRPAINPVIKNFADLAYVGMGVTLFVAVASLIVSTIGGLLERRRSLFTLRLGGMKLSQLKRLVGFESLVPLVSVSLLSCAIGVWTGLVFISILPTSLKPVITPLYCLIVGAGLAMAIVGIYIILPMIKKLTSPEANQTE